MNQNKKTKIALAASAGGHLTQLLKLKNSWAGNETFLITTADFVRDNLTSADKCYVVAECNRNHPLLTLKALVQCTKIILRERPDVVISTGAAVGCISCLLGRILGADIIWIDSITNVEKLSLSGNIIRHLADLFLVQWPMLARRYKNTEYKGALL